MARSNLLSLLPDFSENRPKQHRAVAGFEPLVHAALEREEFTSLDMPVGFTGLGLDPDPEARDSLAADTVPFEADEFAGLDDLPGLGGEDEQDARDELADLLGDLGDLAAGLPDIDLEPELPTGDGSDDVDIAAANAIAAQEALEAAHREEIERLQAEHRDALQGLVGEAIPKVKQDILDALTADLAPLMASRLRAGFVNTSLDALSDKLAEMLDDAGVLSFDLHGPEYLISAFLDTWSGDAAQIRAIPADGVDLVARIDRTVIATRLSEFDRLMQEAAA